MVSNSANVTHVRADGSILVGTLKGLNIIKDGKVVDTIDVSDGLSNNSIADIEEDDNGRIFVATYNGLNILTNINDSLTITQLYKKDGLVGNDFTQEGTYVDDEGNLWLGTLFGITKYNPNVDEPITTPPKIYLTGLQLFNKDFPLSKFYEKPEFNYDENFLKFIFTGINFSAPEKTIYQYRLSSIDKDWVESSENSAPYTNLDDGNYRFEVKARNEWGYWSKPISTSFTITPAWWETWWFYTFIILSVGSLIALIVSYRYKHLLAVEKVRTKISTDLHDSIGSGLTEITFLSQMLKTRVKQDEVADNQTTNITNISKKLITDMRDIVWLVNPSKDSLKDLFYRLKDAYQEITQHSDINIKINNIENLADISLPMNFRQHIYLIFKEAINNSLKYSKCKNITVDIKTKSKLLEVILKDDGVGFDINTIKKGNGLNNMEERAKAINGNIEFTSKHNEGTTIIFTSTFRKLKISEV
ncbi:MAG: triple tyrosine motif-containing protein [Melioribacteraceae bacterium]